MSEPNDVLVEFQRFLAEQDARISAHAAWFAQATRQAALEESQRRLSHMKWQLTGTVVIGVLAVTMFVLGVVFVPWLATLPLLVQEVMSAAIGIGAGLSGVAVGDWVASKRERQR